MPQMPALFVSHGAPTLVVERDDETHKFLLRLADQVPRPKAILCISAHWEAARPKVTANARPETIYDFYGFPEPLYNLTYPAPGAPDLAERVAALLDGAGFAPVVDQDRGLDHGAWIPLYLAYPDASVPVVQLSLLSDFDPGRHLAMGRVLAPLRDEGVLILASGSVTHNLADAFAVMRTGGEAPIPNWAQAFADWVDAAVVEGRFDDLAAFEELAPQAARAHPRTEHFLPLLVAAGAADGAGPGRVLHQAFRLGSLSLGAYGFG